MATIFLKELSNIDLDWLIATGQQRRVAAHTTLLQARQEPESFSLLLDGVLSLSIPQDSCDGENTSTNTDQEIIQFSRGEVIGETPLLSLHPANVVVKAAKDSIVLSILQSQLIAKLQQDLNFSTHFYRAIALILSARLQQVLAMPNQLRAATNQPVKEALLIFGELRDSDVDWLMTTGHLEKVPAGKILVQAGRPLDALYFVLDGRLSVGICQEETHPLMLCFECAEETATAQKVLGYLSRGEMSGASHFLEFSPAPVTVRAVSESLVLSIPRSQLVTKLQQDMGFASRFYRVLATQLAENWQTVIGLMGCPQQVYHQAETMGDGMDNDIQYDDELNLDSLAQVAQGAARFNWMLKQLGVV
ncbi:MAG TPA: cyclic nucleotide-binding domain-containing protein [Chroococcidiopsis sp.]